jgi:hypothetical protein
MRGQGEFADLVRKRFEIACKRLRLNTDRDRPLDTSRFRPPGAPGASAQLDLFG